MKDGYERQTRHDRDDPVTRLAAGRDTHLTAAVIAAEALRQFDTRRSEPTIRALAAGLRASPAAIYHHFDSQAAIYQAAVVLVWDEAAARTLELVPDPFAADPVEVLVAAGLGTRRAWLTHFRLARHMTATPESNTFTTSTLELMATLLEQLGLHGEDAARAFHTYASFMIGSVLFAAERKAANESLTTKANPSPHQRFRTTHTTDADQRAEQTRIAIDTVMDLFDTDPAHDEALYENGLRRLINSLNAK
jgi:AcrR family transcriptional regulator